MQIEKLKISKLHGYISQELEFRKDLSLLVGINGSGKTSVLNAIDWILRFDIKNLCLNSFELIEVTFNHEKTKYILRATQDLHQLKLEMLNGPQQMQPITVNFIIHPSELGLPTEGSKLFRDRNADMYEDLGPEDHEEPLWKFLKALEKPVVISLDRILSVEDSSGAFFIENREQVKSTKRRTTREPITPITKVKQVTTEHYIKYKIRLEKLNERLKANIIMSAFRDPVDSAKKETRRLTEEEVNRLEKKVTDLVSPSTKGAKESTQISSYFGHAKRYLSNIKQRHSSKDDTIISKLFATQFQQIEALAEAFDQFEQEAAREFEYMSRYLKSINRFLSDSGKELLFSDNSNVLSFHGVASPDLATEKNRDIEYLSSGERQILVLFTFLAFIAKKDSVFIIDEPELSLHPKWQLDFLAAFLELKPSDTQLLLATHSPEIVADYKGHCLVLNPKRQGQ